MAGYGTKNSRAVQELIDLGTEPHDIVAIDSSDARLAKAKALGCAVLSGTRRATIRSRPCRSNMPSSVIISAGRDDTSILICLTARHLAPGVRISVAVNAEDNEVPAKRAGADVVVNPFDFAGLLLATTHGGQHIADYLADLASRHGKVRMIERQVRPDEIGKALKDLTDGLGVRIIRDGTPTASGARGSQSSRQATGSWRSRCSLEQRTWLRAAKGAPPAHARHRDERERCVSR